MKVRTCDSFTICIICQLIASNTRKLSAEFILFVSLSAHRPCLFFLSAHRSPLFILLVSTKVVRACQAPEKFCGEPNGTSKHLGFQHLPQVAQARIVCVLASLERNYSSLKKIKCCNITSFPVGRHWDLNSYKYGHKI